MSQKWILVQPSPLVERSDSAGLVVTAAAASFAEQSATGSDDGAGYFYFQAHG